MSVDVIVVGAGPVGLFLSCELRLAGASVILIEKLDAPSGLSKALGMPGRADDYLDHRGLLDRFRARSYVGADRIKSLSHFGMIRIDLARAGLAPKGVAVLQATAEDILEERARELGVDIRRGYELTGLVENTDGVSIEAQTNGGAVRLDARFVVGCDGGHSAVRRLADIAFPGLEPTSLLRLGDVKVDPSAEDLPFLVPLGDGYFRLNTKEPYPDGFDRSMPMTVNELAESAERVFRRPVVIREARWLSRFTDASRQASLYRRGRVGLAGDAAHVFLPAGGPGLLTGIGDAMNLGWKLGAYMRGDVDQAILDSYHRERHAVGQRVITHTRAQGVIASGGERVEALRHILGELFDEPVVIQRLVGILWQTDTRYEADGASPLAGFFTPDLTVSTPQGPQRIADLMHDLRWLWVELDDRPDLRAIIAPLGERVRRVGPPARLGEGPQGALLVRPDGHIAWASVPEEESSQGSLRAAVARWFKAA